MAITGASPSDLLETGWRVGLASSKIFSVEFLLHSWRSLDKFLGVVYTIGKGLKGGAKGMATVLNLWASVVVGALTYWLLFAVNLPHWVCVVGAVGLVILSVRGQRVARKRRSR